jgi:hypothetical protein
MREMHGKRPSGGSRFVVADGGDSACGQDDDRRPGDHEPKGPFLATLLMSHLAAPCVIKSLLRREPSAIAVIVHTSKPVARRGMKTTP